MSPYIPIYHDSCNLNVIINEVFKVRGAQFLLLNWQDLAYWSLKPTPKFYFSNDKLVEMLEYLIDAIYIYIYIYIFVGNRVFQQQIGIVAYNLYLFQYAYNHMKNLMKLHYSKAVRINFTAI